MPPTATVPARLSDLQEQWSTLYKQELPRLAKARDKAQPKWPVHLDHCFARIILDNAVGKDKPWMDRVSAPATRNMSAAQLQAALDLGHSITAGTANLDELNQRSLSLRGKGGPKRKRSEQTSEAAANEDQSSRPAVKKPKSVATAGEDIRSHFFSGRPKTQPSAHPPRPSPELLQARDTVASSTDLTPFRRFVLILLTFVPRGRHTSYGAMSSYITAYHHKCSARAIGNAMRNNPFAPTVPCHRVLAHDGRIGGFCGDWGEQGKHAVEKKKLLADEGVRFDGGGKVVGKPFTDFHRDEEVKVWYEQILGSDKK
ncbi:Methylated-DNA--protein-cysteine methyltransferase [Neofusicoccum parvum]|uniref:Methylated-DNA--protein-cysteine methyltransferase n=1 Tax=Neofusicoccum parvum TaxID=310453 RepID=A0ACB5RNV5_9PEZI|nr:Methylated-DNA--protein-cysteine methyltransferase [Neofusicoccum parvum]